MKDRITVFSIYITIKIPLRFFAFRLCRCSTVKSRSKREKLSLKTLIIPRVRLAIEFPVFGKENEYKGYVTMYYEYEGRDIEVEYSVWFKTV